MQVDRLRAECCYLRAFLQRTELSRELPAAPGPTAEGSSTTAVSHCPESLPRARSRRCRQLGNCTEPANLDSAEPPSLNASGKRQPLLSSGSSQDEAQGESPELLEAFLLQLPSQCLFHPTGRQVCTVHTHLLEHNLAILGGQSAPLPC